MLFSMKARLPVGALLVVCLILFSTSALSLDKGDEFGFSTNSSSKAKKSKERQSLRCFVEVVRDPSCAKSGQRKAKICYRRGVAVSRTPLECVR